MSRGFGVMQCAILQAMDRVPALRVPWDADGHRTVPPGAAGQIVDVYSVRTLQVAAAWVRGEWCTGDWCVGTRQYSSRLRVREAPPRALARREHPPHSCWRQREYVSFSRALHRLVAVQVLWPVLFSGRLWDEPPIALANPRWGIEYVVKC